MLRLIRRTTVALLLAGIASAQAEFDPEGGPEDALHAAVRLATPEERREAALALAAREDVPLERWLELCRDFGRFDAPPPGLMVTRAPLWTPEGTEDVELAVYVPKGYSRDEPAPLLLEMHWTGGSGRGSVGTWDEIADRLGMLVLAPTETGANVGYTFSERERQATLSAVRWMRQRYNVDENRILASGVSRGGHLAWDLALRHPDIFAGIAPMIGGPRIMLDRGENNIRYLENVAHLPIRDLQGAHDDPVLVHNLRLAFDRLEQFGATDARLIEFPELGHWYEFDAVDWIEFWPTCRRDPKPERVVRTFARRGEGRAFWLEVTGADADVQETFVPKVSSSTWSGLDRFERLVYVQKQADKRTGRLEGTRTASRIKLKTDQVTSARVLYDQEMLPKREALVSFGRKTVRKKVEPDAEVLLLEFVERFDRQFLPVFEVRVPK